MTPTELAEIRRRIKINEGVRTTAYFDTLGVLTIGCGFNLERDDAPAVCEKIGTSLERLKAGEALTDAQVDALFDISFAPILSEAIASIGNFHIISDARRFVICDLVYNLGAEGWGEFTNTRALISSGNFNEAANHLVASAWFAQVGGRAVRDVTMLRTGAWVPQ